MYVVYSSSVLENVCGTFHLAFTNIILYSKNNVIYWITDFTVICETQEDVFFGKKNYVIPVLGFSTMKGHPTRGAFLYGTRGSVLWFRLQFSLLSMLSFLTIYLLLMYVEKSYLKNSLVWFEMYTKRYLIVS